jgi:hypothetical protein
MTGPERRYQERVASECALPHGTMYIPALDDELLLIEIVERVSRLDRRNVGSS